MYVPLREAPSNRTKSSPSPFLASTPALGTRKGMPSSLSSNPIQRRLLWRSGLPLAQATHFFQLAGRFAHQNSQATTVGWPGNCPAPSSPSHGWWKPWSLVCFTGSAMPPIIRKWWGSYEQQLFVWWQCRCVHDVTHVSWLRDDFSWHFFTRGVFGALDSAFKSDIWKTWAVVSELTLHDRSVQYVLLSRRERHM